MRVEWVRVKLKVPCVEGSEHLVEVAFFGRKAFEVVSNPCNDFLGAFGAMAPCSKRLRELHADFDSERHLELRLELVEKLAILGVNGIPLLLEMLDDPQVKVCRASAWALGNIGASQPLSHLSKRPENSPIRVISVWSEASRAEVWSRIMPVLCQRLEDERWWVRLAVVKVLGKLADPQTVPQLCHALEDKDWTVRQAAAEALGTIRQEETIPLLCHRLNDEVEAVRSAVAEALGKIGDKSALIALQTAYSQERNHEVKMAIRKAIERIQLIENPISKF